MQVIEPPSWTAQPWKNGAGTTHEVLRLPDVPAFMVRLSVADIGSPAPFSRAQVLREPTAQTLEGTFVAVFVIAGEVAMTRGDERWELGRHACGWLTDGEVTVEPLPGGMAATLVVEAHSA